MQHDAQVGGVPDRLDRLQIADNTIVVFTTDNGAMVAWYPDGGATPFRGETATTWEGGVRVPLLIRWPGRIEAGSVSNGIQAMEDLFTTLAPAAGAGDVVTRLKAEAGVCIDGVNNLAHWTEGVPSARNWNIYCNEGDLTAVRIGPWKSHLQEREGFFDYLRPSAKVFNLRSDPFEHHGGQQADDFAMKMGFADAHRYVADRRFADVPVEGLLSKEYGASRRALIGGTAEERQAGTPLSGGTVYLCTADGEGNMVSWIQSNYMGFGSGIVIPGADHSVILKAYLII